MLADGNCVSLVVFRCLWWGLRHGKGADGLLHCFLTSKWPVIRKPFQLSPQESGWYEGQATGSHKWTTHEFLFKSVVMAFSRVERAGQSQGKSEKDLRKCWTDSEYHTAGYQPVHHWWIILTCLVRRRRAAGGKEAANVPFKDGFAGFSHRSFHSPHSVLLIRLIRLPNRSQGTWSGVRDGPINGWI